VELRDTITLCLRVKCSPTNTLISKKKPSLSLPHACKVTDLFPTHKTAAISLVSRVNSASANRQHHPHKFTTIFQLLLLFSFGLLFVRCLFLFFDHIRQTQPATVHTKHSCTVSELMTVTHVFIVIDIEVLKGHAGHHAVSFQLLLKCTDHRLIVLTTDKHTPTLPLRLTNHRLIVLTTDKHTPTTIEAHKRYLFTS